MAAFNYSKVILVGRLTRDPEIRCTTDGTPLCQFTLAVSRVWRDDSGENREETCFVDIEAWGKRGETVGKYLAKGRPLLVEGRLRQDKWEDRNTGQKRSKLVVVMEGFSFMDAKPQDGGAASYRSQGPAPARQESQGGAPRFEPPPPIAPPAAPAAGEPSDREQKMKKITSHIK